MNQRERETAGRTAQIFRAARKRACLTQVEVSKNLGIAQGTLSKLERGLLVPSAQHWFDFCHLTDIPTQSLVTGFIETPKKAKVKNLGQGDLQDFKVKPAYMGFAGTKNRSLVPLFQYLKNKISDDQMKTFFQELKTDPDYFIDLDRQINIEFMFDVIAWLVSQGILSLDRLSELVEVVSEPQTHGEFRSKYDRVSHPIKRLAILLENAPYYEVNFNYQVTHVDDRSIEFSMTPGDHLFDFNYQEHPVLGDFLFRYKEEYFKQFLSYKKTDASASEVSVRQSEWHCDGADRCVYRFAV